MKFAEDDLNEGYFITAYDATSIQINGRNFSSSLVVVKNEVVDNWPPVSVDSLQPEHIQTIIELRPELVLLGTGAKLIFPQVKLYAELIQRGIGVEVMDTGAACRTYNILTSEGRRAVAGIII